MNDRRAAGTSEPATHGQGSRPGAHYCRPTGAVNAQPATNRPPSTIIGHRLQQPSLHASVTAHDTEITASPCAYSALTLLVRRQEGHPARKKTESWDAGVVICLERGADLYMAQLMPLSFTVSCFSKI